MRAGFIGLGTLGKVMASRLIGEGVELTAWNRTPSRAAGLGATVARSPADVVSREQVVILNLFDSDAVASVMQGPDGLMSAECRGKLIIDTTTNHFSRVEEFFSLVKSKGADYLEAPVLGSVIPASQGNLTVLAGGTRETFDRALPFLNMLGRNIVFLGAPGLATKMKLINNMVLASFMSVLSEAIVVGEEAGFSRQAIIDILTAGAGASGVLNAKKEKLLKGDFSPHFSSAAIYKDLQYVESLGSQLKRSLVHAPAERELFGRAVEKGFGHLDISGIYDVFRNSK